MAKILVEFNGKVACLAEHCRDLGVDFNTFKARKRRTGESNLECLEYYQKYGVQYHNRAYKIKDYNLYRRWINVKSRCYNPKNHAYKWYGGKGIKVCERWQVYENFEKDLLESFLEHVKQYGIEDTTLERIDYDGDYEPANCTWKTRKEQQNNKSTNIFITDNLTATQFSDKYNIPYDIVKKRFASGMSVENIINTPINYRDKHYLPCGILLVDHCKLNNYNYSAIMNYMCRYNLQPHEALARYLQKQRPHRLYYLPCKKSLLTHCEQNNYNYNSIYSYIYRNNLEPHEALARYLENKQKKY